VATVVLRYFISQAASWPSSVHIPPFPPQNGQFRHITASGKKENCLWQKENSLRQKENCLRQKVFSLLQRVFGLLQRVFRLLQRVFSLLQKQNDHPAPCFAVQ
jgi:hypothetical protein